MLSLFRFAPETDMPPLEILKLSSQGSAVALIVTVSLFLAFLHRGLLIVQSIAASFAGEIAASRAVFTSQTLAFQSQISALSTSHNDLARETIRAVDRLESAVRDLQSDRETRSSGRREDVAARNAVRDRLAEADTVRAEALVLAETGHDA